MPKPNASTSQHCAVKYLVAHWSRLKTSQHINIIIFTNKSNQRKTKFHSYYRTIPSQSPQAKFRGLRILTSDTMVLRFDSQNLPVIFKLNVKLNVFKPFPLLQDVNNSFTHWLSSDNLSPCYSFMLLLLGH